MLRKFTYAYVTVSAEYTHSPHIMHCILLYSVHIELAPHIVLYADMHHTP